MDVEVSYLFFFVSEMWLQVCFVYLLPQGASEVLPQPKDSFVRVEDGSLSTSALPGVAPSGVVLPDGLASNPPSGEVVPNSHVQSRFSLFSLFKKYFVFSFFLFNFYFYFDFVRWCQCVQIVTGATNLAMMPPLSSGLKERVRADFTSTESSPVTSFAGEEFRLSLSSEGSGTLRRPASHFVTRGIVG